ncbi:Phosphoribosylformylglycinamidine synthase subunit PurL [Candidatus Hydrogenisulfobacillus filiaventi]|uniref:Phosphoribosylformylglycinamidine synthase subunit PurL n=1 Tax=Candidatus Hydrogenisulfobacillus filiaventi TaxID=2707344 RepID=A0A6F8ZI44_9FIRM|nr:Phosphoribosylformylglycinamidine synthase subunit PurL [Candidatus Hydrogenisulfobacillus filiaventi]
MSGSTAYEAVGLTAAEFEAACRLLGREPNPLELGLLGAMWSEHCSYKSSKGLLAWLPHEGPAVVAGPGGNAGVVHLAPGSGVDVAFKIESHNHPSYVEPVEGAATGVGGIIRDVVAMGARPVALLDSLRFGRGDAHSALLEDRVVEGVGKYGNAIGIPTVAGEVAYAPVYARNPLVNVMCVGIAPHGRPPVGAGGARPGGLLVLMGQRTGRDGIHGASLLASRDLTREGEDQRPTVQVGDPFTGKLLMEATLALAGAPGVQAVQDLGAAGLTSAVSEVLVQSGAGGELDLDRVPCRERGMTAYEIMLSESQERMLLVIDPGAWERVRETAAHWELEVAVIGSVTTDDRLRIRHQGAVVADLPARVLVTGCPRRQPDPGLAEAVRAAPAVPVPETVPSGGREAALAVLADPDVRDRAAIYTRYDWTIQTNTVQGPDGEAAVLRVKGEREGLALAIAGPGRWCAVDPYAGAMGAVVRAALAVAATGARPLGITDGLNAGNPDRPQVYRQLAALAAGIADAARALGLPVVGGNVSLHNETAGEPIWPTPVIGMVGGHPHPARPRPRTWDRPGWQLVLLNPPAGGPAALGGSVLALQAGSPWDGLPYPRADLERMALTLAALEAPWFGEGLGAVRVVTDGGPLAAVVRMWLQAPETAGAPRLEAGEDVSLWFGEGPGQVVAAVDPEHLAAWGARLEAAGVPWRVIGRVDPGTTVLEAPGRRAWRLERREADRAWRVRPVRSPVEG